MSYAFVDPWVMLHNFRFQVYAQKKFSKKLDDEDKEMAYLKYEFIYGTYDFSQQKIIWDIPYHLNPKMTFYTLKWLFSSMRMS